jgi:hypothetical protein
MHFIPNRHILQCDNRFLKYGIWAGARHAGSPGDELSAADRIGVVKTKFGMVWGFSGQDYKTVTLFKGIPYAAPPVGDLRWNPDAIKRNHAKSSRVAVRTL